MRPIKGLYPLATWIMRLAVVLFIFVNFWKPFTSFNFQSLMFYLSAIFIIFSGLLFIGGILQKENLTVVSSLILVLITIYHIIADIGFHLNQSFAIYFLLVSIFLFFLTTGNKR